MYGCGWNREKQLFGDREQEKIEGFDEMVIGGKSRVVKAACGYEHSLLLLEDGSVMGMGVNRF